ncbi:bactofilin family protein [Marinospirillum sp.]|uniref:bactofilin family protein n=1 Tax=Marinospirillum sp. TaxID=2183934 RepID=UPI003A8840E3
MFGKNAPAANHFDTLISSKAEIVGDIHFSGGLHIDGRVHGNIIADDDSKAVLRISDKGRVEGEVSVPHLVVNGTIVGDVHSCEHLELAAKAVVKGNIFYNTVEMVMGAQVDGRLEHRYKSSGKGGDKPAMPKKVTREKPKVATDAPEAKALNKPEPKAMPQVAPPSEADKK